VKWPRCQKNFANVNFEAPPPILDSARVVLYALVGDLVYRPHNRLYRGNTLVERVPSLAICENLGDDVGPMLFHCDGDWTVLGVIGGDSVESCKSAAAKRYPGVENRWIDRGVSAEDALNYYDSLPGNNSCSFCGKRPFQIQGGFADGKDARICKECVDAYHLAFVEMANDSP